jgi:hypothetical protein
MIEAVPQLILVPKILLLFEFKALFASLFFPILNCWTASYKLKIRSGYGERGEYGNISYLFDLKIGKYGKSKE